MISAKKTKFFSVGSPIESIKYKNHKFYKLDLSDNEAMDKLFKTEKFDCNTDFSRY